MRPANIVTAIADVLAGVAISGFIIGPGLSADRVLPIILLCISTIGLYGGGVVFNDVFDAELDRIERPERPIPMGIVSVKEGALLGIFLLLIGIGTAFIVNPFSGLLAMAISVSAVVYDKWGKHHAFLGPLNMGLVPRTKSPAGNKYFGNPTQSILACGFCAGNLYSFHHDDKQGRSAWRKK